MTQSIEQRCRDLLEQCGIEDAQSMTAGDLCPLVNEIVRLKAAESPLTKSKSIQCGVQIGPLMVLLLEGESRLRVFAMTVDVTAMVTKIAGGEIGPGEAVDVAGGSE